MCSCCVWATLVNLLKVSQSLFWPYMVMDCRVKHSLLRYASYGSSTAGGPAQVGGSIPDVIGDFSLIRGVCVCACVRSWCALSYDQDIYLMGLKCKPGHSLVVTHLWIRKQTVRKRTLWGGHSVYSLNSTITSQTLQKFQKWVRCVFHFIHPMPWSMCLLLLVSVYFLSLFFTCVVPRLHSHPEFHWLLLVYLTPRPPVILSSGLVLSLFVSLFWPRLPLALVGEGTKTTAKILTAAGIWVLNFDVPQLFLSWTISN